MANDPLRDKFEEWAREVVSSTDLTDKAPEFSEIVDLLGDRFGPLLELLERKAPYIPGKYGGDQIRKELWELLR